MFKASFYTKLLYAYNFVFLCRNYNDSSHFYIVWTVDAVSLVNLIEYAFITHLLISAESSIQEIFNFCLCSF